MPSVIPMTPDMFGDIHPDLLAELDPNMSEARWRACFDGRWSDEPAGYLLMDKGQAVGLLGTLFSERDHDGASARVCNLHSWYVRPEHRATSLLLLRPVLARRDCTVTDLSASPRVVEISRRLGFQPLDDAMWVLPPVPLRGRGRGACVERLDTALAARLLTPGQRRLFDDHQNIGCEHWWLGRGKDAPPQDACYMVVSRQPHRWLPHVSVHYLSNPDVFARYHGALTTLLAQGGERCITACARWLDGTGISGAWRMRTNQKLFRPAGLQPAQVDALYSELSLLKLPVEFAALTRAGNWLRRAGRVRASAAGGE